MPLGDMTWNEDGSYRDPNQPDPNQPDPSLNQPPAGLLGDQASAPPSDQSAQMTPDPSLFADANNAPAPIAPPPPPPMPTQQAAQNDPFGWLGSFVNEAKQKLTETASTLGDDLGQVWDAATGNPTQRVTKTEPMSDMVLRTDADGNVLPDNIVGSMQYTENQPVASTGNVLTDMMNAAAPLRQDISKDFSGITNFLFGNQQTGQQGVEKSYSDWQSHMNDQQQAFFTEQANKLPGGVNGPLGTVYMGLSTVASPYFWPVKGKAIQDTINDAANLAGQDIDKLLDGKDWASAISSVIQSGKQEIGYNQQNDFLDNQLPNLVSSFARTLVQSPTGMVPFFTSIFLDPLSTGTSFVQPYFKSLDYGFKLAAGQDIGTDGWAEFGGNLAGAVLPFLFKGSHDKIAQAAESHGLAVDEPNRRHSPNQLFDEGIRTPESTSAFNDLARIIHPDATANFGADDTEVKRLNLLFSTATRARDTGNVGALKSILDAELSRRADRPIKTEDTPNVQQEAASVAPEAGVGSEVKVGQQAAETGQTGEANIANAPVAPEVGAAERNAEPGTNQPATVPEAAVGAQAPDNGNAGGTTGPAGDVTSPERRSIERDPNVERPFEHLDTERLESVLSRAYEREEDTQGTPEHGVALARLEQIENERSIRLKEQEGKLTGEGEASPKRPFLSLSNTHLRVEVAAANEAVIRNPEDREAIVRQQELAHEVTFRNKYDKNAPPKTEGVSNEKEVSPGQKAVVPGEEVRPSQEVGTGSQEQSLAEAEANDPAAGTNANAPADGSASGNANAGDAATRIDATGSPEYAAPRPAAAADAATGTADGGAGAQTPSAERVTALDTYIRSTKDEIRNLQHANNALAEVQKLGADTSEAEDALKIYRDLAGRKNKEFVIGDNRRNEEGITYTGARQAAWGEFKEAYGRISLPETEIELKAEVQQKVQETAKDRAKTWTDADLVTPGTGEYLAPWEVPGKRLYNKIVRAGQQARLLNYDRGNTTDPASVAGLEMGKENFAITDASGINHLRGLARKEVIEANHAIDRARDALAGMNPDIKFDTEVAGDRLASEPRDLKMDPDLAASQINHLADYQIDVSAPKAILAAFLKVKPGSIAERELLWNRMITAIDSLVPPDLEFGANVAFPFDHMVLPPDVVGKWAGDPHDKTDRFIVWNKEKFPPGSQQRVIDLLREPESIERDFGLHRMLGHNLADSMVSTWRKYLPNPNDPNGWVKTLHAQNEAMKKNGVIDYSDKGAKLPTIEDWEEATRIGGYEHPGQLMHDVRIYAQSAKYRAPLSIGSEPHGTGGQVEPVERVPENHTRMYSVVDEAGKLVGNLWSTDPKRVYKAKQSANQADVPTRLVYADVPTDEKLATYKHPTAGDGFFKLPKPYLTPANITRDRLVGAHLLEGEGKPSDPGMASKPTTTGGRPNAQLGWVGPEGGGFKPIQVEAEHSIPAGAGSGKRSPTKMNLVYQLFGDVIANSPGEKFVNFMLKHGEAINRLKPIFEDPDLKKRLLDPMDEWLNEQYGRASVRDIKDAEGNVTHQELHYREGAGPGYNVKPEPTPYKGVPKDEYDLVNENLKKLEGVFPALARNGYGGPGGLSKFVRELETGVGQAAELFNMRPTNDTIKSIERALKTSEQARGFSDYEKEAITNVMISKRVYGAARQPKVGHATVEEAMAAERTAWEKRNSPRTSHVAALDWMNHIMKAIQLSDLSRTDKQPLDTALQVWEAKLRNEGFKQDLSAVRQLVDEWRKTKIDSAAAKAVGRKKQRALIPSAKSVEERGMTPEQASAMKVSYFEPGENILEALMKPLVVKPREGNGQPILDAKGKPIQKILMRDVKDADGNAILDPDNPGKTLQAPVTLMDQDEAVEAFRESLKGLSHSKRGERDARDAKRDEMLAEAVKEQRDAALAKVAQQAQRGKWTPEKIAAENTKALSQIHDLESFNGDSTGTSIPATERAIRDETEKKLNDWSKMTQSEIEEHVAVYRTKLADDSQKKLAAMEKSLMSPLRNEADSERAMGFANIFNGFRWAADSLARSTDVPSADYIKRNGAPPIRTPEELKAAKKLPTLKVMPADLTLPKTDAKGKVFKLQPPGNWTDKAFRDQMSKAMIGTEYEKVSDPYRLLLGDIAQVARAKWGIDTESIKAVEFNAIKDRMVALRKKDPALYDGIVKAFDDPLKRWFARDGKVVSLSPQEILSHFDMANQKQLGWLYDKHTNKNSTAPVYTAGFAEFNREMPSEGLVLTKKADGKLHTVTGSSLNYEVKADQARIKQALADAGGDKAKANVIIGKMVVNGERVTHILNYDGNRKATTKTFMLDHRHAIAATAKTVMQKVEKDSPAIWADLGGRADAAAARAARTAERVTNVETKPVTAEDMATVEAATTPEGVGAPDAGKVDHVAAGSAATGQRIARAEADRKAASAIVTNAKEEAAAEDGMLHPVVGRLQPEEEQVGPDGPLFTRGRGEQVVDKAGNVTYKWIEGWRQGDHDRVLDIAKHGPEARNLANALVDNGIIASGRFSLKTFGTSVEDTLRLAVNSVTAEKSRAKSLYDNIVAAVPDKNVRIAMTHAIEARGTEPTSMVDFRAKHGDKHADIAEALATYSDVLGRIRLEKGITKEFLENRLGHIIVGRAGMKYDPTEVRARIRDGEELVVKYPTIRSLMDAGFKAEEDIARIFAIDHETMAGTGLHKQWLDVLSTAQVLDKHGNPQGLALKPINGKATNPPPRYKFIPDADSNHWVHEDVAETVKRTAGAWHGDGTLDGLVRGFLHAMNTVKAIKMIGGVHVINMYTNALAFAFGHSITDIRTIPWLFSGMDKSFLAGDRPRFGTGALGHWMMENDPARVRDWIRSGMTALGGKSALPDALDHGFGLGLEHLPIVGHLLENVINRPANAFMNFEVNLIFNVIRPRLVLGLGERMLDRYFADNPGLDRNDAAVEFEAMQKISKAANAAMGSPNILDVPSLWQKIGSVVSFAPSWNFSQFHITKEALKAPFTGGTKSEQWVRWQYAKAFGKGLLMLTMTRMIALAVPVAVAALMAGQPLQVAEQQAQQTLQSIAIDPRRMFDWLTGKNETGGYYEYTHNPMFSFFREVADAVIEGMMTGNKVTGQKGLGPGIEAGVLTGVGRLGSKINPYAAGLGSAIFDEELDRWAMGQGWHSIESDQANHNIVVSLRKLGLPIPGDTDDPLHIADRLVYLWQKWRPGPFEQGLANPTDDPAELAKTLGLDSGQFVRGLYGGSELHGKSFIQTPFGPMTSSDLAQIQQNQKDGLTSAYQAIADGDPQSAAWFLAQQGLTADQVRQHTMAALVAKDKHDPNLAQKKLNGMPAYMKNLLGAQNTITNKVTELNGIELSPEQTSDLTKSQTVLEVAEERWLRTQAAYNWSTPQEQRDMYVRYGRFAMNMLRAQKAVEYGVSNGSEIHSEDIMTALQAAYSSEQVVRDRVGNSDLYQNADPYQKKKMMDQYIAVAHGSVAQFYQGKLPKLGEEDLSNLVDTSVNANLIAREKMMETTAFQEADPIEQGKLMKEYTSYANTLVTHSVQGRKEKGMTAPLTLDQVIPLMTESIDLEEDTSNKLQQKDWFLSLSTPEQVKVSKEYKTLARSVAAFKYSDELALDSGLRPRFDTDLNGLIDAHLASDEAYYTLAAQNGGVDQIHTLEQELANLKTDYRQRAIVNPTVINYRLKLLEKAFLDQNPKLADFRTARYNWEKYNPYGQLYKVTHAGDLSLAADIANISNGR